MPETLHPPEKWDDLDAFLAKLDVVLTDWQKQFIIAQENARK